MLKNKTIAAAIAVLFLFPAVISASVAGSLDKRFDTAGDQPIPAAFVP